MQLMGDDALERSSMVANCQIDCHTASLSV
jgi:hypothetical protein